MNKGKLKICLKENKYKESMDLARYCLSYNRVKTIGQKKQVGYEILSKLKGTNDVFIEVKTNLLTLEESLAETCALDFLKAVNDLGLSYRTKKVIAEKRNILGGILNFAKKKREVPEILAYVPDAIWRKKEFYSILPIYGVRYYICKEPVDGIKVLDQLFNGQINNDQQLELFNFLIFDCSSFSQMGINSKYLSCKDINKLLDL